MRTPVFIYKNPFFSLLCLAVILLLTISCTEKTPKLESVTTENLSKTEVDSILSAFKFKYASPIIPATGNYIILPVSTLRSGHNRRSYDYSSSGKDAAEYWNAMFYNRLSNETRLLSTTKMRITQIYTEEVGTITVPQYYKRNNTVMPKNVLYRVIDHEYNNDGTLTDKDPEGLFISGLDGLNFKRISPKNEDLTEHIVFKNPQQIILQTRRDSNQDKRFTSKDELIWYKAEMLCENWQLTELIGAPQQAVVEKLFFEQWMRKK